MAEFEAKITGIADLSKAKQDFDGFKKQIEQPIKLTFDASGFNAVWGNIKQQAQQAGANVGKQLGQGIQNNIKNTLLKVLLYHYKICNRFYLWGNPSKFYSAFDLF